MITPNGRIYGQSRMVRLKRIIYSEEIQVIVNGACNCGELKKVVDFMRTMTSN